MGDINLSFASSELAFSRASFGMPAALMRFSSSTDLVRRVVELAKFLLNGLHLLIQVVLALALLHLLFDAATDALFDLQHIHLALDDGQHVLQALAHVRDLENFLLLRELQGHVRGDGIRQASCLFDAGQRGQDLRRGTFLFNLTYCSNWVMTERVSTSISRSS